MLPRFHHPRPFPGTTYIRHNEKDPAIPDRPIDPPVDFSKPRDTDARELVEDVSDDEDTPVITARAETASHFKPKVPPADNPAPPTATSTSGASGGGLEDHAVVAPAMDAAPAMEASSANVTIASAKAVVAKPATAKACAVDDAAAADQNGVVRPTVEA
jgi:hypothetical protein